MDCLPLVEENNVDRDDFAGQGKKTEFRTNYRSFPNL